MHIAYSRQSPSIAFSPSHCTISRFHGRSTGIWSAIVEAFINVLAHHMVANLRLCDWHTLESSPHHMRYGSSSIINRPRKWVVGISRWFECFIAETPLNLSPSSFRDLREQRWRNAHTGVVWRRWTGVNGEVSKASPSAWRQRLKPSMIPWLDTENIQDCKSLRLPTVKAVNVVDKISSNTQILPLRLHVTDAHLMLSPYQHFQRAKLQLNKQISWNQRAPIQLQQVALSTVFSVSFTSHVIASFDIDSRLTATHFHTRSCHNIANYGWKSQFCESHAESSRRRLRWQHAQTDRLNQILSRWCLHIAGRRRHKNVAKMCFMREFVMVSEVVRWGKEKVRCLVLLGWIFISIFGSSCRWLIRKARIFITIQKGSTWTLNIFDSHGEMAQSWCSWLESSNPRGFPPEQSQERVKDKNQTRNWRWTRRGWVANSFSRWLKLRLRVCHKNAAQRINEDESIRSCRPGPVYEARDTK